MSQGIYIDKSNAEAGEVEYSFHGLTKRDLKRYKLAFETRRLRVLQQKMELEGLIENEKESILKNAYTLAIEDLTDESSELMKMIQRLSQEIF